MTYTGTVDFGDEPQAELADHGLVFMSVPFGESYTQPIGVYATKWPRKGAVLAQLVIQAINLLEQSGAILDGIVCDGASTNHIMWHE